MGIGPAKGLSTPKAALITLAVLSVFFWTLLLWSVRNMSAPIVQLMMPKSAAWTGLEFFAVWAMWAVMMGAMMLPSAIPMVRAYQSVVTRNASENFGPYFVWGYLVVWCLYSLAVTGAQWLLQASAVLTPMLVLSDGVIAGMVVILAGVVQWTPLKNACLEKCRTPLGFLITEWRKGATGGFQMGLKHGAVCVGCCWALMAVLFVLGVMNIFAIAAVTCIVAAEKILPKGEVIAKLGGVVLVVWGGWLVT